MKILIIEDEIPAAKQLEKLLLQQSICDCTVLDVVDSILGAVYWLKNHDTPDLIFMDIQIADGLSFEIFKKIDITSAVIFTTAYDQYAIKAFKVNALDYLLKPIEPNDLANALKKVQNRLSESSQNTQVDISQISKLLHKSAYKTRFLVKNGASLAFLNTSEIAFFRSENSLTKAHTKSGKRFFVEQTLGDLEDLLDPADFYRISRNMTVCVDCISKIHNHFNGRLKLELLPECGTEVFVSRDRVAGFKIWLGG